MTVTEVLSGLGSWELELKEETPESVRKALGYFGHIVIVDGRVDVQTSDPDSLLDGARYVGVTRSVSRKSIGGSGMLYWLGDEDGKGPVLEGATTYTDQTLAQIVNDLVPRVNAVSAGTTHPQTVSSQRYNGFHQFQTVRQVLDIVAPVFEAEYQVTNDGRLNVGTPAQLYGDTPEAVVRRKGSGSDIDLTAVSGDFKSESDVYDFTTRVVLLGQTQDDKTIAEGAADAPSLPYFNLLGNPVRITRTISESSETPGSVTARAQLALNRFYRANRAVKLDLEDYESDGQVRVGEYVWVYDPDVGMVDNANEVYFRGEVLRPVKERVAQATWRVTPGMTVAFRSHTGVWTDLTTYIAEETGSDQLVVGDLDGTLTRPQDRVSDRIDSTRGNTGTVNAVAPNPPTNLQLTTSATLDTAGRDAPVVTASWTAPTQNVDSTVLTDLDHYEVNWKWSSRSVWESTQTADATVDLSVAAGLPYQVRVRAVDSDGQKSSWTGTVSITSAKDSSAPPAPSDPQVSTLFGALRVRYSGTTSTGGQMPSDANRIDVEIASASGGPWSVVDSLNPFVEGYSYPDTPYGATRYIRFVAYDHQGNRSGYSATVSGSSSQVVAADIFNGAVGSAALANLAVLTAHIDNLAVNDAKIGSLSVGKLVAGTASIDIVNAGRITTALTGSRRELNAIGFQAWDSSNNMLINLNGVDNLLTGKFRTALSGRRVEMDNAVEAGSVRLYAPGGRFSQFRGFTAQNGRETMQIGLPRTDITNDPYFNRISIDEVGLAIYNQNQHTFIFNRDSQSLGVNSGWFRVQQSASEGTTGIGVWDAFRISQNEISFVQVQVGDSFRYSQRVVNGDGTVTNWTKFWIDEGTFWFRFHVSNGGDMRIGGGNGDGSASPKIILETNAGNGARLRAGYSGANGSRIEVRNVADSGYEKIFASAFTVQSEREVKSNIVDVPESSLLSIADSARPRMYDRIVDGVAAYREMGLVADESPAELKNAGGDGVNLYPLATAALALGQWTRRQINNQVRPRVEDHERRIKILEDDVVALKLKLGP